MDRKWMLNGSIQYISNENGRATRLVLSQSKLDLGKVETPREENPLNMSFIVETFLSFFRKTKENRFALQTGERLRMMLFYFCFFPPWKIQAKVFKNGPRKIFQRVSSINFTWSIFKCLDPYMLLCAICYHLHNLKNVKTLRGVLLLVKQCLSDKLLLDSLDILHMNCLRDSGDEFL